MLKTATFHTDHGSEIEYLAITAPAFVHSFDYAWITCLDSIRSGFTNSPHIKTIIDSTHTFVHILPEGLLMDINGLSISATEFHLFNGFDEIWLARNADKRGVDEYDFSSPPVSVSNVANSRCTKEDINELLEWMNRLNLLLGIADGVGLEAVMVDENSYDQLYRIYRKSGPL